MRWCEGVFVALKKPRCFWLTGGDKGLRAGLWRSGAMSPLLCEEVVG